MTNNNMQSSPTVMLENIKQQPYRSENRIMATTSTNNIKKPILIIRSQDKSPKTTPRNVHFVPEIIADDEDVTIPIQNSQSTSSQIQKLPSSTMIQTNHQCTNN